MARVSMGGKSELIAKEVFGTFGAKYGFINKSGKYVVLPVFDDASMSFSEGLGTFKVRATGERDRWGYMDAFGKKVIEAKYIAASKFSEGLAAVCTR